MVIFHVSTYLCPVCDDEIDESQQWYLDGEPSKELGCRECENFFLRETAKFLYEKPGFCRFERRALLRSEIEYRKTIEERDRKREEEDIRQEHLWIGLGKRKPIICNYQDWLKYF